ncbi:arabinosyltransferase domain-containing protein [Geodermatophilus sp. SYSU D00758]
MDVIDPARSGERAPDPAPAGRRGRVRSLLPLLVALVAVLCAVLLPLAPVRMALPTVSWPQEPTRPTSTMLELTNQTPRALDVRFSCAAVRAAASTGEGLLLSTLVPGQPAADTEGLLVTARDGRLDVLLRGVPLLDAPLPPGQCTHRLRADGEGAVLQRDGTVLASVDEDVRPDVDVLATGVTSLPGDDDLRVALEVDAQFNTTPTAAKLALSVAVTAAALACLLLLARADRRRGPPAADPGPPARVGWPGGAVDVLVVAAVLLWWFLAPASDDDGYYAAMARNAGVEGQVGNYYQLLNQSFTPFTWFYRVLGWWQEVGDSPVVLRVPALVVGLLTWLLLRRYVSRPGALPAAVLDRRGGPAAAVVLTGAAFLAWWLPYGMGVRPEAIVGVLALAALTGVVTGLRRRRLLPVGLGFAAAALAAACHPTGLAALGPVLVALPRLAGLVREGADRLTALTRTALLVAPGALAAVAAFADGTLNDFLRGQEIFLSVQEQDAWYDEFQRYAFLLSEIPMGSYARRTAVLLGLLALVWFLALAAAARVRGVAVPLPLLLAGSSLGAGFLLLWITPSKWTHHFGALAGVGPAFLGLFLVSLPWLVRRVTRDRPAGTGVRVAALGSLVLACALAFQGPNQWAYSWLPGMPQPMVAPYLGPVELGSPVVWALVVLAVLGALTLLRRRTGRPADRTWVAVPVAVLVFLGTSLTYLLGSFSYATLTTLDGWSPWADALTDPLATDCAAAGGIEVYDVTAGDPLPAGPQGAADAAPEAVPSDAFATGAGWFGVSPPPWADGGAAGGAAPQVWGSLTGPEEEDTTGTLTTGWYELPAGAGGEAPVVLAAGQLAGGNGLRAEYAVAGPAGTPRVTGAQELTDAVDSTAWRSFVLDPATAGADAADLVRLVAEDRSGGPGGWLAFAAPVLAPAVPLGQYLPEDAAVATAWQIAFLFPCQRQPEIRLGITEPVTHGVVWRPGPGGWGLADNTWQVPRGGLFAPVQRTSGVTELATRFPAWPDVRDVQAFEFDLPYPTGGYDLAVDRATVGGWSGPPTG